jgi:hypothetical protein
MPQTTTRPDAALARLKAERDELIAALMQLCLTARPPGDGGKWDEEFVAAKMKAYALIRRAGRG